MRVAEHDFAGEDFGLAVRGTGRVTDAEAGAGAGGTEYARGTAPDRYAFEGELRRFE